MSQPPSASVQRADDPVSRHGADADEHREIRPRLAGVVADGASRPPPRRAQLAERAVREGDLSFDARATDVGRRELGVFGKEVPEARRDAAPAVGEVRGAVPVDDRERLRHGCDHAQARGPQQQVVVLAVRLRHLLIHEAEPAEQILSTRDERRRVQLGDARAYEIGESDPLRGDAHVRAARGADRDARGGDEHVRVVQQRQLTAELLRLPLVVVVAEGHERGRGGEDAGVAGARQPGRAAVGQHPDRVTAAGDVAKRIERAAVADDDDLEPTGQVLREDRRDRTPQQLGPGSRGDHDGDGGVHVSSGG